MEAAISEGLKWVRVGRFRGGGSKIIADAIIVTVRLRVLEYRARTRMGAARERKPQVYSNTSTSTCTSSRSSAVLVRH